MWRYRASVNAFSFVELWTLSWQQVASVFSVCLGERCGLWLDVASVRLDVAVQVGHKQECRVGEWVSDFWTLPHSLTLGFGSFGSHNAMTLTLQRRTRRGMVRMFSLTAGCDDGWWMADDVMWGDTGCR